MKPLILLISLLVGTPVFSQSDSINFLDENCLKQGMWVYRWKKRKSHYLTENRIKSSMHSQGYYKDNIRIGLWKWYDRNESLVHEFDFDGPLPSSFVDLYPSSLEELRTIDMDTVNQRNDAEQKHGYWVFFKEGILKDTVITKQGYYNENRKVGIWNFNHPNSYEIRLQTTFVNNKPSGLYYTGITPGKIDEFGFYKFGRKYPFGRSSIIRNNLSKLVFTLKEIELKNIYKDRINCIDEYGYLQGNWIVYGWQKPELGFADSSIIEKGRFVNDLKKGEWVYYFKNGKVKKTESYVANELSGFYVEYFENGNKKQSGVYKRDVSFGYQYGFFENGCAKTRSFFSEIGKMIWSETYDSDTCGLKIKFTLYQTSDVQLFPNYKNKFKSTKNYDLTGLPIYTYYPDILPDNHMMVDTMLLESIFSIENVLAISDFDKETIRKQALKIGANSVYIDFNRPKDQRFYYCYLIRWYIK